MLPTLYNVIPTAEVERLEVRPFSTSAKFKI